MEAKEGVWDDQERFSVFLVHPGQRVLQLTVISCFKELEPDAKCLACRLCFSQKDLGHRVGGIPEDGHPCDRRDSLLKQFNPFSGESLTERQCGPREVAARSREVVDEAPPHGVGDGGKDDRGRQRRLLRRQRPSRRTNHQDVHLALHELGDEGGKAVG
jgi:hypothetical protein